MELDIKNHGPQEVSRDGLFAKIVTDNPMSWNGLIELLQKIPEAHRNEPALVNSHIGNSNSFIQPVILELLPETISGEWPTEQLGVVYSLLEQ